ncbi:polysaccharide synthase Cps1p [Leptodontidium sp. MPI-SDFR-AT-0119]|nr:polysaccharide synthase Cps1p [Leptodontidium sp. MPI-SDFR-AT-0119]
MNASNLRVLKVPVANKRLQVCEAIPLVKTLITVLADDDVIWPTTIMHWFLSPFEDKAIGAVGTCQRVRRLKTGTPAELCFNWLGAAYIERRNFEISATHKIDGGTSYHSFMLGYAQEKWRDHELKADDDNFITRWLVAKKWKTWIQWVRSNWRSNFRSMLVKRHTWEYVLVPAAWYGDLII